MTYPERELVDAMAALVLAAYSKFDARLHGKRELFPEEELFELWQALQQYCGLMKGLGWIHRDVAREISGFREHLQLQEFGTPGEVLALTDAGWSAFCSRTTMRIRMKESRLSLMMEVWTMIKRSEPAKVFVQVVTG